MIRRVVPSIFLTHLTLLAVGLMVGATSFLLWTFVLAENAGLYMRRRAERKAQNSRPIQHSPVVAVDWEEFRVEWDRESAP